ncbi:MAG: molybdate ABC transporter substrate-binding protein [Candidatus Nitricoxidivorans perseverans]|jgi:molybdate transport system substrate-binding protein|uniref:Molybdate ABC transporter substrate-binding protein n=1 Tax=Candidatus Nitricoxidivorans perseverans TaxID=2975601 RepID=A0AA49IYP5_9PROT|nr:MAG: molybdate ABC transporter substrate-binding protein [Candidatus Nitricoxidivorans perseverans]
MKKLLIAVLGLLAAAAHAQDAPPIAAAADLKFALAEIAQAFEKASGQKLKVSYGSSGNFTHQIEQGAHFELFLSADENYIFRLADKGIAADRGALYAVGRVVLFAPHGSTLKVDEQLADLKAALADGRLKRFAIANPDHAPYGRAARAALQHAGLWDSIQPKLVLGENASQATQFAAAGSSQGGIVPLSLFKAPEIAKLGSFALIPAEWHAAEPLRQRMALTRKAGETARAFYDYLQQPAARAVFVRYGFVLPDGK